MTSSTMHKIHKSYIIYETKTSLFFSSHIYPISPTKRLSFTNLWPATDFPYLYFLSRFLIQNFFQIAFRNIIFCVSLSETNTKSSGKYLQFSVNQVGHDLFVGVLKVVRVYFSVENFIYRYQTKVLFYLILASHQKVM